MSERAREHLCVCVCVCCCRCRRAAAAAAAAWPFGNFIDTDTTQSVGNCCIQRFVRSPTELIFRIRLASHSARYTNTKLARSPARSFVGSFVRSLVRTFASFVARTSCTSPSPSLCRFAEVIASPTLPASAFNVNVNVIPIHNVICVCALRACVYL